MAITKAMLARCQNEKMQAFCALDKDVQDEIVKPEYDGFRQRLRPASRGVADWYDGAIVSADVLRDFECVFRLSPDTPTEPEVDLEEFVVCSSDTYYAVNEAIGGFHTPFLLTVTCHVRFLGIVYLKDGVETLRPHLSVEFGTPLRVRLRKAGVK